MKVVLSPEGRGLADDATLTVNESRASVQRYLEGTGRVRLAGTVHDPLDEIDVVDVRGASYVEADVEVRSQALARIPAHLFLPYAYGRLDYWPALATA